MRLKVQMLSAAAAYCRAVGWSEDRLARTLFRSGRRLRTLREGSDMASGRVEDALQWLSDRWPADVPWPEGATRPEPRPLPEAGASADG